MTHRPISACALVLMLAACTAPPTTDAPPMRPSFADPAFAARVFGYREVTLTPRTGTGDETKPLTNVACTLGSSEIQYPPFTAPARIALPEVTGKPEPLDLRCDADDLHATMQLAPEVDSLGPLVPLPVGFAIAGAKYAMAASEDKWVHYARRSALIVTLAQGD